MRRVTHLQDIKLLKLARLWRSYQGTKIETYVAMQADIFPSSWLFEETTEVDGNERLSS